LNVLFQTTSRPSALSESHLPRFFLATQKLRGPFWMGLFDALKALWALWILHTVLRVNSMYEIESQKRGQHTADHDVTPVNSV
jgi:hypothetical protein